LVAPFQGNSARAKSKNRLAFSGNFTEAAGQIVINFGIASVCVKTEAEPGMRGLPSATSRDRPLARQQMAN
jgi:hypothetical protein